MPTAQGVQIEHQCLKTGVKKIFPNAIIFWSKALNITPI